jgi:hypothetical protein
LGFISQPVFEGEYINRSLNLGIYDKVNSEPGQAQFAYVASHLIGIMGKGYWKALIVVLFQFLDRNLAFSPLLDFDQIEADSKMEALYAIASAVSAATDHQSYQLD